MAEWRGADWQPTETSGDIGLFAIGNLVAGSALAVKALGVGLSVRRRAFHEFLFVRIWFALLLLEDLLLLPIYHAYGTGSPIYARAYYWSDLAVVLVGFLVLIRLAEVSFSQSKAYLPLLRGGAIAILAGIAILSIVSVFGHLTTLPGPHKQMLALAMELEQNVSVAGMLASILLWISINILAVPGVRLRRIVAGLGIFYSASGGSWALVQLFGFGLRSAVPFFALFAEALLAYALAAPERRPLPPSGGVLVNKPVGEVV
jgi:hypothetical protein